MIRNKNSVFGVKNSHRSARAGLITPKLSFESQNEVEHSSTQLASVRLVSFYSRNN
jgi:hypothetical protein